MGKGAPSLTPKTRSSPRTLQRTPCRFAIRAPLCIVPQRCPLCAGFRSLVWKDPRLVKELLSKGSLFLTCNFSTCSEATNALWFPIVQDPLRGRLLSGFCKCCDCHAMIGSFEMTTACLTATNVDITKLLWSSFHGEAMFLASFHLVLALWGSNLLHLFRSLDVGWLICLYLFSGAALLTMSSSAYNWSPYLLTIEFLFLTMGCVSATSSQKVHL